MAGVFISNGTVAAISTVAVDGTIFIIRMSGVDASSITDGILNLNVGEKKSYIISYGYVYDQKHDELIDEVLVNVFRAPKTFTCEDIVGINRHGRRSTAKKVLRLCLAHSTRLASPGGFTQRAFLDDRIDLTRAEAVDDMVQTDTGENVCTALQGIHRDIEKLLESLIQDLLDVIASIGVNIDYPEYGDVGQLSSGIIQSKAKEWMMRIRRILDRTQSGQLLRGDIETTIIDKLNIGKSNLLNMLLEGERAIMTNTAGTTHDIVGGYIHLQGLTLNLIDTAGIRDTKDVVEQTGIRWSLQAISEVQLIAVISDSSHLLGARGEDLLELTKDKTRTITCNRAGISHRCEGICISAVSSEIESLAAKTCGLFDNHQLTLQEPLLQNERRISLMMRAGGCMRQAFTAMKSGMELDIAAIDIQEAYAVLEEILGEVHCGDLLDALFSNFCLRE